MLCATNPSALFCRTSVRRQFGVVNGQDATQGIEKLQGVQQVCNARMQSKVERKPKVHAPQPMYIYIKGEWLCQ